MFILSVAVAVVITVIALSNMVFHDHIDKVLKPQASLSILPIAEIEEKFNEIIKYFVEPFGDSDVNLNKLDRLIYDLQTSLSTQNKFFIESSMKKFMNAEINNLSEEKRKIFLALKEMSRKYMEVK